MRQETLSQSILPEWTLPTARFLIVDDELANVRVLETMLKQWHCGSVVGTTDPHQALSLFNSFQPDIILLDLMMPGLDGFQVMEQLRPLIPAGTYLPILVLTADTTTRTKHRALAAGARDFLTKPFDALELSLRLHNLAETRFLHLQLEDQNRNLEEKVHERTRDLERAHREVVCRAEEVEKAQVEMLERLAQAAEWRDDDTGQHTRRVGRSAALLAQALGLSETAVGLIHRAAPLHDVGKIGVPDSILLKPGKLTDAEFSAMTTHTTIGARMLANGHSELVHMAERIALTHHERWDGGGYPNGRRGPDIPIEGRIVAVSDVFDALTHERPYKAAWPVAQALLEITGRRGSQFDPGVVEAFLTLPHDTLVSGESL